MSDLVAQSVSPRGDGHAAAAHGLWDASTSVPTPHDRPENQLTHPLQTPPAQRCSSFWRNVGAGAPRWTPTPAGARYTAPPAPPQWVRRAVLECDLPLAGLARRPSLASKTPVRHPNRGQGNWPGASPGTRQPPCVRSQVAIEGVTHLLECLAHPSTGWVKRTTLALVEHAAYRRTIPEHPLSRRDLDCRFLSCGQTRRLKGISGME